MSRGCEIGAFWGNKLIVLGSERRDLVINISFLFLLRIQTPGEFTKNDQNSENSSFVRLACFRIEISVPRGTGFL